MASNSDSIFNLLSYLHRHPQQAQKMPTVENNIVRLKIDQAIKVSYADIYFPKNHLMVNRLTDSFVAKHGELLDYYQAFTKMKTPHYHEVWVTSSFITPANCFFIELSFE
ncbi:MAG: hypothetical protein ABF804_05655 [Liquorilactobacillus ghanensis]|jgi:hypothetical protein|uniref:Uncharacterized protein n=1 Tax=Liquorilactobacillus ghanensis DSM 18630 TaxID=1423750 RepID=A0A0R1VGR4_9LACO|nr:hypothetical protein [Liquorilactobacillus ghanensis]KRM04493.1 hypothetical protein FC89_GL002174 [Liquorilactobacillus ghanensis DSM 18630]